MTESPVHFSAHLRAQVPVHLRERADARNTSLGFHRQRSHAVPTVVLPALNGKTNRRLPCPRIQHRNTEIVTTFDQVFWNIQRAIEYRVSREPFSNIHIIEPALAVFGYSRRRKMKRYPILF